MANMIPIPGGQVHPDVNLFAAPRPLPARADRQKIIEQAELVLSAAQAIVEQCDQAFALLSAERPAAETAAAASPSLQRGP